MNRVFSNKQLPFAVILVWLAAIGILVWHHAHASMQPPIWDALTYYQKAENFWLSISNSNFINPFNIEPTFRPPGTILLTYPFGFGPDFRPFYFRTVYIPVILLSLAVFVSGYRPSQNLRERWNLAAALILSASLPSFYHFEVPMENLLHSPGYWGLVDNFLAALAAFSAAFLVHGIRFNRRFLVIGAFLLSAFCLCVKPSGIFPMAIIGFALLLSYIMLEHFDSRVLLRHKAELLIGLSLFSFIAYAAFTSQYLSPKNIAYGKNAVAILREWRTSSWIDLFYLARSTFGYVPVLLPILFVSLMNPFRFHIFSGNPDLPKSHAQWLVACAAITFSVGLFFWLVLAGGANQIRYFLPFAMMAGVFILPAMLSFISSRKSLSLFFRLLCILPAANLLLMLAIPDPAVLWQRISGVNLLVGTTNQIVIQAEEFASMVKVSEKPATLYSASLTVSDGIFDSIASRAKGKPLFVIKRPLDWQRVSAFRMHEMAASDFILFSTIQNPAVHASILKEEKILTFNKEEIFFRAWLAERSNKDGVHIVSDVRGARLLKITDRRLFHAALTDVRNKHIWRQEALDDDMQQWWTPGELKDHPKYADFALTDIHFGDIVTVNGISLAHEGNAIKLSVWIDCRSAEKYRNWILFIHSIDEKGDILEANEMSYCHLTPPSPDRTILMSTLTVHRLHPRHVGLALGFLKGDIVLAADKGIRDWNNRRVLLSFTK